MKVHVKVTLALILLFLAITTDFSQVVKAQTVPEEAISLQKAGVAINQAFDCVLDAEKAGVNVTDFLIRLNMAGQLLADAQNAHKTGNLTSVTSKADNAKRIADQVNDEAITLKDASLTLTRNNFWYAVIFSIGGAVIFCLVMVIVWQRLKRSRTNRLFSMRPELVE